MSRCLTKLEHECGTKSGLQVFEKEDGTVDGFCFACGTYIEHPFGEPTQAKDLSPKLKQGKTDEEVAKEIEEINQLEARDIPERKLRKDVLDHFGIKVGVSEEDGKTPTYVHLPYTKNGEVVKYKTRILQNKRMWMTGREKNVDLFGWEQAKASGAKRLIITEGEFDAVALTKMLDIHTKEEYKGLVPAVVSVCNGAGGAVRDISRNLDEIRKHFKEISLAFDSDEAGREAAHEVCRICPEATVITLPDKDANACLLNGRGKAAHKAATFNAGKPKNTRLVWGREIHEKAKEKPQWGLSWPWDGMTDITRGIRYGETIYIAAGEKMG